MSRDGTLSGLANLNDRVRVIDRDGTDLGCMMVAEAQKIASDQRFIKEWQIVLCYSSRARPYQMAIRQRSA
jgi:translation initiation factor IF-3